MQIAQVTNAPVTKKINKKAFKIVHTDNKGPWEKSKKMY